MARTIVVVYSGARVWGGIETYLRDLFLFHDPSKMRLVLVSLGEWELNRAIRQEAPKDGAGQVREGDSAVMTSTTQRCLSPRRVRPRTILDIRGVLKEEHADLVVSQGAVANAYARMAALLSGLPSLVVTHSELTNDYPRTIVRWGFTLSDRLLRPITKRYIAVSWYLKNELVRSGVSADQISVVYNGVDIRDFGVQDRAPLPVADGNVPRDVDLIENADEGPAISGAPRDVNIVSVGRLHRVKNFDALIKAMGLLPGNMRLTIWGDGEERDNLERLIESLGLGGRVKLAGRAGSIPPVLAKADLYVQPSKSEGFGLAVVEAMLCGRPVVVAPHGSLPELVEDGETGIVAADCSPEALAASIRRVVCDVRLASRLATAGQEVSRERFSIERWLEGTTAAFAEAST
jgi:glycosyltransferase involved in cell wall biosynthesis